MSDLPENKGFPYQFNNLIFANQKWKKSDSKRDFSPDFQNVRQEFKNLKCANIGERNNLFINAINSNSASHNIKTEWKEEKTRKEKKIKL